MASFIGEYCPREVGGGERGVGIGRKKIKYKESITELIPTQSQEMSLERSYEHIASPYKLNMEKKGELSHW